MSKSENLMVPKETKFTGLGKLQLKNEKSLFQTIYPSFEKECDVVTHLFIQASIFPFFIC